MTELATWGSLNAVKATLVTASVGKPYFVMNKINYIAILLIKFYSPSPKLTPNALLILSII